MKKKEAISIFREMMNGVVDLDKTIPYLESIGFFTGNFYKCGDETEFPHYGMWSEAVSDTPDFHRPECFGRLIPDRPIR